MYHPVLYHPMECELCVKHVEKDIPFIHCKQCIYCWCTHCDRRLERCPYCRVQFKNETDKTNKTVVQFTYTTDPDVHIDPICKRMIVLVMLVMTLYAIGTCWLIFYFMLSH